MLLILKGFKKTNSYHYNKAIWEMLLKFYFENRILIEDGSINSLIEISMKVGEIKIALQIFRSVLNSKKGGITLQISGLLIKNLGFLRRYEEILEIYRELKLSGVKINEITFGCMIDALVNCQELEKALELIQEEKKEIKINTVIYSTLIKGYSKVNNLGKALEILNFMEKSEELEARPNLITYNTVLDCAVRCNDFKTLEELYNKICLEDKPDLITLSTYIKGLCRNRQTLKAYEIFVKSKTDKSLNFDEVMYNSLLDGLVKSKEYSKTEIIYEEMLKEGIKPSNVTYSILIKLYGNQQKYTESLELLKKMKEEKIAPGIISLTCLLQICVKLKNIELMEQIYNEVKKRELRGDAVFYNTLVSGFVYNNNLKRGIEILLEKMSIEEEDFYRKNYSFMNEKVYANVLKQLCYCLERNNYSKGINKEECEIYLLKIMHGIRNKGIDIDFSICSRVAKVFSKKHQIEGNFKNFEKKNHFRNHCYPKYRKVEILRNKNA